MAEAAKQQAAAAAEAAAAAADPQQTGSQAQAALQGQELVFMSQDPQDVSYCSSAGRTPLLLLGALPSAPLHAGQATRAECGFSFSGDGLVGASGERRQMCIDSAAASVDDFFGAALPSADVDEPYSRCATIWTSSAGCHAFC